MRALLIDDGKVAGEFYGATVAELTASNPDMQFVADTSGLPRVIGMAYADGVLSGEPTPEPAPTPQVPQQVTMRQARLALLGAGLLGDIDTAIAALPSPQKEKAQIEWEYSGEVQRHNGFVSALAPSLGLTDAQIDALFVAADTL